MPQVGRATLNGIALITLGRNHAPWICAVNVELFDDADESVALDDVKNRIDAIDTFPEEAEKPIVSLLTPKRSVMDIAISGPSEERALKVIAQRVRDEIAALPGITQVELLNTRPYEVSIEVSEESLRRYGLSFSQVAAAVRKSDSRGLAALASHAKGRVDRPMAPGLHYRHHGGHEADSFHPRRLPEPDSELYPAAVR